MEELKIEYKFDIEDFKAMENIEKSYFPDDNITPAKEVLNWYKKNNLTCIGLRNDNNEIIASVNVLPLNKKVFYDIYEDKMNEADVTYSQIEEYENNKTYYIDLRHYKKQYGKKFNPEEYCKENKIDKFLLLLSIDHITNGKFEL